MSTQVHASLRVRHRLRTVGLVAGVLGPLTLGLSSVLGLGVVVLLLARRQMRDALVVAVVTLAMLGLLYLLAWPVNTGPRLITG